jgi:hypothetical protein
MNSQDVLAPLYGSVAVVQPVTIRDGSRVELALVKLGDYLHVWLDTTDAPVIVGDEIVVNLALDSFSTYQPEAGGD